MSYPSPVGKLRVKETDILNSTKSNYVINKIIKFIADYSVKWPIESAIIPGE